MAIITKRFDPYKNFKFRVKFGSSPAFVAGISKVGALKRTTEVVKHREGGDPSSTRKSPGRSEYEAITLERGVTHDAEFERWANKVWNYGSGLGAEVSLKDFRRQVGKRGTELIPWLQDFSLGRTYTTDDVRAQIDAARRQKVRGFLLWNPEGVYTPGALEAGS